MRFTSVFLLIFLLPFVNAEGHFLGGSLSFNFINDTNMEIRSLLSWDLGYGPCGPGCNWSKIGTSTKTTRDQILQSNGLDYFGNWSYDIPGNYNKINITLLVTDEIEGRIISVNEHLQWELEYAKFDINMNDTVYRADVILEGKYWKPVNILQPKKEDKTHSWFHLQVKVHRGIRNDTGKPNNSPVALFKPVYSIELNTVTEIKLTTMDPDGDVCYCEGAKWIEAGGLNQMKGVSIEEVNCSIFIDASESNGFEDNGTVVVLMKVMDYNHNPISITGENGRIRRPFDSSISDIPVQFLVRSMRILHDPTFVPPTPEDHHKFEVYAGTRLVIELYARPHISSKQNIETISVMSLQRMDIPLSTLTTDPQRASEKIKYRVLTWDTLQSDVGTYIIQATPIDTGGIDGKERNFFVVIKDVNLTKINTNDVEDLNPLQGRFTCLQNNTCTVPVMFSPGQIIKDVILEKSTLPGVKLSPLRQDKMSTFKTEFNFLGYEAGNQSVCLRIKGLSGELVICVTVTVIPTDQCLSRPCGIFGVCFANWDTYHCVCRLEHTGENCETEINHCEPNPCAPGNCLPVPFSPYFICMCPGQAPGGTSCETSTILPNTTAVPSSQGTSTGPPFATSPDNTIQESACKAAPCQNRGVCEANTRYQYTCNCPVGFMGINCEISKDIRGNYQPYFTAPNFESGTSYNCPKDQVCVIPLTMAGGHVPIVEIGSHSGGLNITVPAALTKDLDIAGRNDLYKGLIMVTPLEVGVKQLCVKTGINLTSVISPYGDTVCYNLKVAETGVITRDNFMDPTPATGSIIRCSPGRECHIFFYSRPINGICPQVAVSRGQAYVFPTVQATTRTSCITDVSVKTDFMPSDLCLKARADEMERCIKIEVHQPVNTKTNIRYLHIFP